MNTASVPGNLIAALPTLGSVFVVDNVADLVSVYAPHLNICLLRRSVADEVKQFVMTSLSERELEHTLRVPASHFAARELLPAELARPAAEAFVTDVRFLAQIYADLTGAEELGIRLVSTRRAMCPRFHVDRVGIRLVCTYSGPGTEYVAHADVDRQWLGHRAGSRSDAESGLLRGPQAVACMAPFHVGLLKGEAWPNNEGRGAVHRSPAVLASEPRRVFLSIEGL